MDHIFHPTDLGPGSATAFLHALRIATATRGVLTIMHVDDSGEGEWSELPGVRETLSRWGLLKDAQDMEGLRRIGVGVRKLLMEGDSAVNSCLHHLSSHPTDLIVLATHQDAGGYWRKRRVAEPLARGAGEPTLFVPAESHGFVDGATGRVSLQHILVPIAASPDPQRSLDVAMRAAEALSEGPVHFTLLHVGTEATRPHVNVPEHAGWTFEHLLREGDPIDLILEAAENTRADLVVMTTKGHDGFLDMFRGSNTERVLRAVHCPVMAVPAL